MGEYNGEGLEYEKRLYPEIMTVAERVLFSGCTVAFAGPWRGEKQLSRRQGLTSSSNPSLLPYYLAQGY